MHIKKQICFECYRKMIRLQIPIFMGMDRPTPNLAHVLANTT
jgi:hypothetical protein